MRKLSPNRTRGSQAARLSPDHRLATYELPAVEMVAAFVYQGSPATIEETYAALALGRS
jgi:hypothetical protein